MASYRSVICINCGVEKMQSASTVGKFCSNKCQAESISNDVVRRWLAGDDPGYAGKALTIKRSVRRYLLETRGAKCELCGWDNVHPVDGKPLVQIDHIDGDAKNNIPSNLRILCPNCHSMTSTFGNRNKGSSRNRK